MLVGRPTLRLIRQRIRDARVGNLSAVDSMGVEPGLLYEYSRQARGHQNGWLRVIPNFATTYN